MIQPNTRTGRNEDIRLTTGRGRFADDLPYPGTLAVAFVRSSHACGRLLPLDCDAARSMAGVVAVLTEADLRADGIGTGQIPLSVEGPDGRKWVGTPRPLLVADQVRHVGEPVAMVLAATREQAQEAAEAVIVRLEETGPAVAGLHEALTDDASQVWGDRPGNIAFEWRRGDWDALEAALGLSERVARISAPVSRVAVAAMEPRTAHASIEGGRITLHVSHQGPLALHAGIAKALGMDKSDIRVITGDVGGSFGMKAGLPREEILVCWAARRTGRPLRWTADRTESFLSDEAGRDVMVEGALGLDAQGHFTALSVTMKVNVGAYATGRSMPTIRNLGGIAGVYRIPVIGGAAVGVFSHTVPTASYRGAGRPEATFAIERLIDKAAQEFGFDPFELRLKNLISKDEMPYSTAFLFTYDSGDFRQVMLDAAEQADLAGYPARRAASAERGMLRGIGVANCIEVAAGPFGNPAQDFAEFELGADGIVTVASGIVSAGTGLETTMIRLAAQCLEIPEADIRLIQGDTDLVRNGKGMGGSAGLATGGAALVVGAGKLLERARNLAAAQLGADPAELDYAEGIFRVSGTNRGISLTEIARTEASNGGAPLTGEGMFKADHPTYPNGCHICEVEIDPETGQCEIVRYAATEDIGQVLNPQMAEGQIHGGVAQGLGQVLCEAMRHGPGDAQVLSASFMDYAIPRARDLPFVECSFNSAPTDVNPLKVKGVGEAGTVGALSAGMNAVCNALASAGVADFEMPASPARIWTALQKVQTAGARARIA